MLAPRATCWHHVPQAGTTCHMLAPRATCTAWCTETLPHSDPIPIPVTVPIPIPFRFRHRLPFRYRFRSDSDTGYRSDTDSVPIPIPVTAYPRIWGRWVRGRLHHRPLASQPEGATAFPGRD
ncbi:hypothetical protein Emed_007655 [Eimeria media]